MQVATSEPAVSFVRIAVCHHRAHGESVTLAVATLPWWTLREGVRVLSLDDPYGRRLVLAKLVVCVEMRGERLSKEKDRLRVYSNQRPSRPLGRLVTYGIDVTAMIGDDEQLSIVGFKQRHVRVKEEAGAVRLSVKRKSGDAPCIVSFSTSDGTAVAGENYQSQNGQLFFLRGQKTKEIKVLIIDDDEAQFSRSFHITLTHPENCAIKPSRAKVRGRGRVGARVGAAVSVSSIGLDYAIKPSRAKG